MVKMFTRVPSTMTFTLNLEKLAQQGQIDLSWAEVLSPVQNVLDGLEHFLSAEHEAKRQVLPALGNIMRAFQLPFLDVTVVIVGQDPYPTPGDAVGLSFSVDSQQQSLPRSLKNIYTELNSDVGFDQPVSGDLSAWAQQGVMLLNRVLTVSAGAAGSHRGRGWEEVTECALRALDARVGIPLVAVLWGNDAQKVKPFLSHAVVIESAHPSPLSASRGFFGSKPFSKVNAALSELGRAPIEWAEPNQSKLF
jgi:uracil-DNA glycosylase